MNIACLCGQRIKTGTLLDHYKNNHKEEWHGVVLEAFKAQKRSVQESSRRLHMRGSEQL